MPILRPPVPDIIDSKVTNTTPREVNSTYRSSIVDTKFTPVNSLLTHLSGATWVINYYSQVVDIEDELKPFAPTMNGVLQQYKKVNRCEVLIQGELSSSLDNLNVVTITGTAIIYPGLKPNVGDAFVADIGDGRAGQFTVTAREQLSIFKETAWSIQFAFARYADEATEDILNSCVVKEMQFQRDYLTYGQNPYLASEDYASAQELEASIVSLQDKWLKEFWNPSMKTILVPSQLTNTYDPYLTDAVVNIFGLLTHRVYRNICVLNCDDHNLKNQTDLWTMLVKRDPMAINEVFRQHTTLSATDFSPIYRYNSVRYSGVRHVVAPRAVYLDYHNNAYTQAAGVGIWGNEPISLNESRHEAMDAFIELDPTVTDNTVGTTLPRVGLDGYYVLSKAFYEEDSPNMTKFERLLWQGIHKAKIDISTVLPYFEAYHKWSKLDRFYLGVVLLILMRYSLRSL